MSVNPSSSYLLDYWRRAKLIAYYPLTGPQLCGAQAMTGVAAQLSGESGFSAQVLGRLNGRGLVLVTRKVGDSTFRVRAGSIGWQERLRDMLRNTSHLARVCPHPWFGQPKESLGDDLIPV